MSEAIWLVDIGYVVKASEGKFKLDYVAAEQLLGERLGPVTSFLFNGYDPDFGIPAGLQAFYNAMQDHGMQVRLHPMQSGPAGHNRQRRVDVDFSAHLVWQASRPEVGALALTTGDQDFIPAVEIVQREFGKRVVLFSYSAMVHHDLSALADEWWHFEHYEAQLVRHSGGRGFGKQGG